LIQAIPILPSKLTTKVRLPSPAPVPPVAADRAPSPTSFGQRVSRWQQQHGRRELPWQKSRDPYAIWISEVMLQQTQVATVIPYFERFLARFPDVHVLAAAELDSVMQYWSGLGYYSRARNLHRAAQHLVAALGGVFPRDPQALAALPGVGRSTACAIAALAFGMRCAILDANVKRVLCRAFGIDGDPGAVATVRALWALAEDLVPERGIEAYTQGMMDLGATVCLPRAPRCERCPLTAQCVAAGSGHPERWPARRARPQRREGSATMLVLQHGTRILLEKRAPSGIWGGLWCLPQIDAGADLESVCAQRFGAHALRVQELPRLVHDFTHLRLVIQPLQVDVGRLASRATEPGVVWIAREEVASAALPAPIKKLLETR
jgi:A/G-specific adenine glycosylase